MQNNAVFDKQTFILFLSWTLGYGKNLRNFQLMLQWFVLQLPLLHFIL